MHIQNTDGFVLAPDFRGPSGPQGTRSSDDATDGRDSYRLLWIDDEPAENFGAIKLLELEIRSLAIECAESGTAGLRQALTRSYAGLILDLHLPDVSGLKVLERLVAANLRAPVLVLSGWADAESTVAALRMGAANVRSKPIFGDELVDAVRELLSSNEKHSLSSSPSSEFGPRPERPDSLSRLLDAAHALANPILPALDFVRLCRGVKYAAATHRGASSRPNADHSHPDTNSSSRIRSDSAVGDIFVRHLATLLSQGVVPNRDDVAHALDLTTSELTRYLKMHTGASLREVRRALRIRPAVREVAYSLEFIGQIAYRHGYEHPGQFDRDFRLSVGISPRRFRALFK